MTVSEAWRAESDRLRALAVRATSADHARALQDRADGALRLADRAETDHRVMAPFDRETGL